MARRTGPVSRSISDDAAGNAAHERRHQSEEQQQDTQHDRDRLLCARHEEPLTDSPGDRAEDHVRHRATEIVQHPAGDIPDPVRPAARASASASGPHIPAQCRLPTIPTINPDEDFHHGTMKGCSI